MFIQNNPCANKFTHFLLIILCDIFFYVYTTDKVMLMVKNPTANAGDTRYAGSILTWGRSPGEGNDNPSQYSCLENSMDRGAWRASVHGATESQTLLETKQGYR